VAIEIGADAVEDLARELILFPFLCVESENVFSHKIHAFALQLHQVVLQEVLQALVELESNELSTSSRSLLLDALTATTNRLTVARIAQSRLLMDTGAVVVDMAVGCWISMVSSSGEIAKYSRIQLHVPRNSHFLFSFVDLFDAFLEVCPYFLEIDVFQTRVAAEIRSRCHDALTLPLLRPQNRKYFPLLLLGTTDSDYRRLTFFVKRFCVLISNTRARMVGATMFSSRFAFLFSLQKYQ
jgi:hypothetical protein